jgi:(1->4)-alpha-D-glucan 1-alpha-D-glucosylmutase
MWDFSLVDPDNRRLVDYSARRTIIANEVVGGCGAGFTSASSADASLAGVKPAQKWSELLRDWRTGAIKLHVTRALLKFRSEHMELFRSGEYQPIETRGRFREHVVAFARTVADKTIVVAVPRLTSRLGCPPLGLVWDNATLVMPTPLRGWRDVVTGETYAAAEGLALADVFHELPFTVLVSEG